MRSTTRVPALKGLREQVVSQWTVPSTVPSPSPTHWIWRVMIEESPAGAGGGGGSTAANRARTSASVFRVRSQAPFPEQSPLQPTKAAPLCATDSRWTACPAASATWQSTGQSAPIAADRTAPGPVTEMCNECWPVATDPVPMGPPQAARSSEEAAIARSGLM